jgi:hypothetical protein
MVLSSCSRSEAEEHEEDKTALFQQLHGKYKVISSRSSEAIDINMDGMADENLLSEIADLVNTHLEMHLNTEFLFSQFWPEQYFSPGSEPPAYDPTIVVHYARQGVVRRFKVDNARKQISLLPDEGAVDPRFVRPDLITIEANSRVEVITHKRLYTHAGWKTVRITTLYERYTM